MATTFHEVRFPEFIAVGAVIGPGWKTGIVEFSSGKEQRNQEWEDSRLVGDISHAIQEEAEYDIILQFFRARRGKHHGFRFKDWTDFVLFQEPTFPDVGDGFITEFQITQTNEAISEPPALTAVRPQLRTILKIRGGAGDPINTVDSPGTIVRVNGSSIPVIFNGAPASGQVSVNTNTGVLTFETAPSNNATVDYTGEFDVPVRFDTDQLPATIEDFNSTSVNGLPILELNLL